LTPALLRRLGDVSTAFASGWMQLRGGRRRAGYDRGFALSDHADCPGLIQSVRQSGAGQVYVTHGNSDGLARYLREVEGISAEPLEGGHGPSQDSPDPSA
jgi:putative mRNA 3-end processing factor